MLSLKPAATCFAFLKIATPLLSVTVEYTFWLLELIKSSFAPFTGEASLSEFTNTITSEAPSFTINPRSESESSWAS